MRTNAERAKIYRDRAIELRALADKCDGPEATGHVLAAASFYEDMAAELEKSQDLAASIAAIARRA